MRRASVEGDDASRGEYRPGPVCPGPGVQPLTWSGARVARSLRPGEVVDAHAVRAGYREIRDLEVDAPQAADAAGYERDALTDDGARCVDGLGHDAEVERILALPVVDITRDTLGTIASLQCRPLDRKIVLPAVHQGGVRHGQGRVRTVTHICAPRRGRRDRPHQDHESHGSHDVPPAARKPLP